MDTRTEQQNNTENNLRLQRRRRLFKCLAMFSGIVLIVGCFVMASYSYMFLEDCKKSHCKASPSQVVVAKVFRFLSAGIFIIGVFLVGFSMCTCKENNSVTTSNSDLRRVSLHTVACVIPDAAKEKSPSIFYSQAYCNLGLSLSSPGLNGIPEESNCELTESQGPQRNSAVSYCHEDISSSMSSPGFVYSENDMTLDNFNPPPTYIEALSMKIPSHTTTI